MINKYEKVLEKADLLDRPAEKTEHWLKMGAKEEFDTVCEKYPDIPRNIILKTDMIRRGIEPTQKAIQALQDPWYCHAPGLLFQYHHLDHTEAYKIPQDMMFNDGTPVRFLLGPPEMEPYTFDLIDGKFWVLSDGKPLEEMNFRERPQYYGKKTSSGKPMESIIEPYSSTDMCFIVSSRHCGFWNDANECRYCDCVHMARHQMKMGRGFTIRPTSQEVYESMCEYLKENRRFRHTHMSGGSDPKDDFDREFQYHLSLVEAVNRAGRDILNEPRYPLCLVMTPLEKERMIRYRDAGVSAFAPYIDAWPRERFEIVCPGKAKYVGFDTWVERMIDAVEIFGKGNVMVGLVLCEMAPPPYGVGLRGDIDEAVGIHLDGCDFFLSHDMVPAEAGWFLVPGSFFYRIGATIPPLEFFVRVGLGRFNLLKKKGDLSNLILCPRTQVYGTHADWQRYL